MNISDQVGDYTNSGELVILEDQKPSGTDGGEFNSGAWRTRDLNAVINPNGYPWIAVPDGFEDNQFDNNGSSPDSTKQRFSLNAGRYRIIVKAPAHKTDSHMCRLQNITDSAKEVSGSSGFSTSGASIVTNSDIVHELSISSQKTFEVQHQCQTSSSVNGFGVKTGFDLERYTRVLIERLF